MAGGRGSALLGTSGLVEHYFLSPMNRLAHRLGKSKSVQVVKTLYIGGDRLDFGPLIHEVHQVACREIDLIADGKGVSRVHEGEPAHSGDHESAALAEEHAFSLVLPPSPGQLSLGYE